MSTIVLKFGGTSVATTDLIESAANIVKSEYDKGSNIVVVVKLNSAGLGRLPPPATPKFCAGLMAGDSLQRDSLF